MFRECSIYSTLKRLSKQRVAMILRPGNFWVIENALPDNEQIEANLRTCHMRGWVVPIHNSIPKGRLKKDGSLPDDGIFDSAGPIYGLTDSGWNAIHRTHVITLLGVIIALLALIPLINWDRILPLLVGS